MSGRPLWEFNAESRFKAHKGLTRIFYLSYQSSGLNSSFMCDIFEIKDKFA